MHGLQFIYKFWNRNNINDIYCLKFCNYYARISRIFQEYTLNIYMVDFCESDKMVEKVNNSNTYNGFNRNISFFINGRTSSD